ncbi:efflux transporter, outer membrane factor (OMF) lipoprotein, NodT family [Rhodospirillales bacterium URHD0017]|nr:efflux transporter, outer membrane factor (OMF) lipoprotein, NodT family [Rhodospirillales bacterium URHD0017]
MMSSRYVLTFAAVVTASGCMVGPDYKRPPPADPPSLAFKETTGPVIGAAASFQPAMPRDAIDRGPWWSMYDDHTLDRLAAQIDISNQTLIQAEAAYRQARALVRQDASGLYPTVTGNAGYTQSGSGSGSSRAIQGTVVNASSGSVGQFSAGPGLNWEIDLWGRIRRQVESDSAAAQASAADLANARLSAQANMAINYFSMRISEQRMRVYQASVAAYTRSVEIVQNQLDAGIVSRVDLAQAQTQLEQTRAQLVAENITRATFEHAVAILAGKAPSELSVEPGPVPPEIPTVEPGIPSTLLERRPDIAAAERQMAAANAQIGVAVAAYYPSISLASAVTLVGSSLNALLTLSNAVWSVGPQLAATLIDGGALRAQVEGARARYDSQVALYRQTILVAFQQVEDALVQQRVLEQQEKVQRAAVAAARLAERLSLNQYQLGTVPYTTVVQTQTAALSSEQTLLSIRLNRLTASANLVLALGGGWRDSDLPAPYPIGGINRKPQPPMPTPQSLEPDKPWWKFWSRS